MIDPRRVYERNHLSGFSKEGRVLALEVNQRLTVLLDRLIARANVSEIGVALRAAGLPDSSPVLLDIQKRSSLLAVGISSAPGVNAWITPAGSGHLILMTWGLYWLLENFVGGITAGRRFTLADGTISGPLADEAESRDRFAASLAAVRSPEGAPFTHYAGAFSLEVRPEYEFSLDVTLLFAMAHEIGHLVFGHMRRQPKPPRHGPPIPSNFYSASEEIDADAIGSLLLATASSETVPDQFWGCIILFQLLDVVERTRVGSASDEWVDRLTARARSGHPHPALRTELSIRTALWNADDITLDNCDTILDLAEFVAGAPTLRRDPAAGARLEALRDPRIEDRLFELLRPPPASQKARIVEDDQIGALLRTESEAIATLATASFAYLNQVVSRMRVVSSQMQLTLAHVYLDAQRDYGAASQRQSREVQAALADVEAFIPEIFEMMMLFFETMSVSPKWA